MHSTVLEHFWQPEWCNTCCCCDQCWSGSAWHRNPHAPVTQYITIQLLVHQNNYWISLYACRSECMCVFVCVCVCVCVYVCTLLLYVCVCTWIAPYIYVQLVPKTSTLFNEVQKTGIAEALFYSFKALLWNLFLLIFVWHWSLWPKMTLSHKTLLLNS